MCGHATGSNNSLTDKGTDCSEAQNSEHIFLPRELGLLKLKGLQYTYTSGDI